MEITLKVDVKLQPFSVPNYVTMLGYVDGAGNNLPKSLRSLEPKILSQLCDQFREEVFKKAGKNDPYKTTVCVGHV